MSPLVLVGITLLTTAFGDVSHVLQGQAHPPKSDPQEVSNVFGVKDGQDFWWMQDDSPFKASYKYFKKCAATGKCATTKHEFKYSGGSDSGDGLKPIDIQKNIFLNGGLSAQGASAVSFSSSSSGSGSSAAGAQAVGNGVKINLNDNPFFKGSFAHAGQSSPAPFAIAQHGSETGSSIHFGKANIDLSKNPFFNNQIAHSGASFSSSGSGSGVVSDSHVGGGKIDLSKNVFLKGQTVHAGQSGAAFGLTCNGIDRICVPAHDCVNGLVANCKDLATLNKNDKQCRENEICCQLPNTGKSSSTAHINEVFLVSGKSSVPGSQIKLTGVNGLTAGQVQVISSSQEGIRPQFNYISEHGSTTVKPIRDLTASASQPFFSSTPDYSNVNFGDDARFSNLQGLDYLPPKTDRPTPTTYRPTTPSCPPGQYLSASGRCEAVHRECPPGTRPTPSGGCERLKIECGPGQKLGPYGQCVPISIPEPPKTCAPGQQLGSYGQCIIVTPSPPTPTPPSCPPGKKLGPYGQCVPISIPEPPKTCPPGQELGPYGQCITITPPPQPPSPPSCPPGKKLTPYGQCVPISVPVPPKTCPLGQELGPYGQCITVTPSPPHPTPVSCPPGYKVGPYGQCVVIPTQTPPPRVTCAPGQVAGPFGKCITSTYLPPEGCKPGQEVGPYGQCINITPKPPITCRPGEQLGPNGQCIIIPISCGPGQRLGPYGECINIPPTPSGCAPGQRLGPNGECITVTTPHPTPTRPTCPPGSFPTAYGGCQKPITSSTTPSYPCPPGTVKSPSGRCETPPTPPRPVTCPSGSFLGPFGNCIRPTPPTTTRIYLPPETGRTTEGYRYPTPTPPYTEGHHEESGTRDKTGSPGSHIPIRIPAPGHNETVPIEQIPVGCAAALKCVQEIYCTAEGFVSPVPVVLTKEQELLRAPTTTCRDVQSGTVGKCCRDLDYKDPWPSANLVDGVDNGQYAEDDSIGQYKVDYQRFSRSPNKTRRVTRTKRQAEGSCGIKHLHSQPPGPGPIDADFAEIPWQAMILRDSNRSLLCGGTIIHKNAVLTSAACVEGLDTSDILIKGGEWKLGIDEEPLPFQIVKVAAIARHPEFKTGSLLNNLAVLVLEENLRFTKNIDQICLPSPNLIPTQNCISTGWGKRILQLHARGAIMHKIDISVMNVKQCQQVLAERFPGSVYNYNTNTLCGFSNIDQCRIDYGSALACADESGRYFLSGVFSWDTGCKQQGQIGAYVAPDVEWIESVVATPVKTLKKLDRAYNNARLQEIA